MKHLNAHREDINRQRRELRLFLRLQILEHYGKEGKLLCCWDGCGVVDPDMLTIDHIENDGAEDRRNHNSGVEFMRKLKKNGFPDGYQTLCWNHQWKKEMARRRLSIPT